MNEKKSSTVFATVIKWVVVVGVLVGLYNIASHYFTLECFQAKAEQFKHIVDSHFIVSAIGYILAMIATVALSLPTSIPLALVGGFLFGIWWATLFTSLGILIGAVLAFILFRSILAPWLRSHTGPKIEMLRQRVAADGPSYLLMMHYSTVVPFFIINAVAALSGMSFATFFIVTIVGSLPLNLFYSFAGGKLATLTCASDIFSWPIILSLAVLIGVAFAPVVIRTLRRVLMDNRR